MTNSVVRLKNDIILVTNSSYISTQLCCRSWQLSVGYQDEPKKNINWDYVSSSHHSLRRHQGYNITKHIFFSRLDDLCYDNTNIQVENKSGQRLANEPQGPRPNTSAHVYHVINDLVRRRVLMPKDFLGFAEEQPQTLH